MKIASRNFIKRLWLAGRNVFVVLAGMYGLINLGFLLARVIVGEQWVVIAFYNTIAPLLWLGAIFLLLPTLLIREWRVALLLCPTIATFVWVFGANFLPRSVPPVDGDARVLRLMSHNLGAERAQIEAILRNIETVGADIVILQEISIPAGQTLESALRETYPYQALHPSIYPVQGMAVLSRLPITEDEYWIYEWLPSPLAHQRVVIELNREGPLVLYNIHTTHPGMNGSYFDPTWRNREIDDLLQRAGAETQPLLLMGDFNMPELSDDYRRLTAHFNDAYDSVGWGMGWTFPALPRIVPLLRLDYLFYSDGITVLDAAVWADSGGSDHLPLIVGLTFKPNTNP